MNNLITYLFWEQQQTKTLGARGDKSSNNGDANELFYYPKASAALNLHNFEFCILNAINQFKLHTAYAEAGNFAPNNALLPITSIILFTIN